MLVEGSGAGKAVGLVAAVLAVACLLAWTPDPRLRGGMR